MSRPLAQVPRPVNIARAAPIPKWASMLMASDTHTAGQCSRKKNGTIGMPAPIAVSIDPLESHGQWIQDINETQNTTVDFPILADADRKVITRTETVKEHLTSGGKPLGHGYTAKNLADGTAYYTFDPHAQVRGIVLDTVNPNGESSGSLDEAQFTWLKERLQEVSGPGRDKLVLLFSHHTIGSMTNSIVSADSPGPRVLGTAVRDLLLQFPNVVAWVNGHTHVNRVTPYPKPGGGGFWEINTAAHIDWPCQARLIELLDNHDGTLSVFGTVLDGAGPLSYGGRLDSSLSLASLARELAANDWQERSDARRGKVEDRNVELLVKAPFALTRVAPAARPPVTRPTPTSSQLPATGAGGGTPLLAAGALAAAALAVRSTRSTGGPQHTN